VLRSTCAEVVPAIVSGAPVAMTGNGTWVRTQELVLATAFALVAGYTDVITIVRWRGFCTMMTGNLIFLARSFLADDPSIPHTRFFYMLLIVTFFIGIVAYRVVEMRLPNRGASTIGIMLGAAQLAAMMAFIAKDWGERWGHYLLAGLTPMFGMLMAACTSGKLGAPTNLITGHLVTVASLGTKAACGVGGLTRGERHKVAMSSLVIAGTLLGAACGAAACYFTSEDAEGLLWPVPPGVALLLWCYDHLAKPRSLVRKVQLQVRERRARRRRQRPSSWEELSTDGSSDSDRGAEAHAVRPPVVQAQHGVSAFWGHPRETAGTDGACAPPASEIGVGPAHASAASAGSGQRGRC